MLVKINRIEDYQELMKLCVIILIIIGRKTASNIPLCAPHAPVPPVGEYHHGIHQQPVLLRQVCNNHGFLLNNV